MNKEFVSYEQALALKELGFDEPCLGNYKKTGGLHILHYGTCGSTKSDNFNTLAPLYQQAFKWFREKYGLSSEIHLKMSNNRRKIWYNINELDNRLIQSMYFKNYLKGFFKTYEEAELECLKKLIEIVKNDNRAN